MLKEYDVSHPMLTRKKVVFLFYEYLDLILYFPLDTSDE